MDYNIAATLQMLIGFGSAAVVIVTIMRFKLRKLELERGPGDRELADAVEALRLEMHDMRAEHTEQLTELQERVEFAERLLTKGRGDIAP